MGKNKSLKKGSFPTQYITLISSSCTLKYKQVNKKISYVPITNTGITTVLVYMGGKHNFYDVKQRKKAYVVPEVDRKQT